MHTLVHIFKQIKLIIEDNKRGDFGMNENKSIIQDGSFINIQSFMVKDLHLKGNELMLYAIIWGFSQDGTSAFKGSLQYLMEWTNSTKQGVLKALKSLQDKGYIQKSDVNANGRRFCDYFVTKFNTGKQSLPKVNSVDNKVNIVDQKVNLVDDLGKHSLPHNIVDNIENNIEDSISVEASPTTELTTPTKQKEIKHKYGEYLHVLLTDKQYTSLIEKYGQTIIDGYIQKIDEWIQLKGKSPYKDFNLAIQNWLKKDNVQPMITNNQNQDNGGWW